MPKKRLTDRALKALKPAKAGQRYDVMDADVRGFGIRVTDKGQRTFILVARYPGSTNPTRRALGEYPTVTLVKARAKAQRWHELIGQGIHPRDEEERLRLAELRKRADTFGAVVDEFAQRVLVGPNPEKPKQRRGHIVARELRREFGRRWDRRPISSISRADVLDVINGALDRGAPYQAHNLLGHIRALFNWAIASEKYGLELSPCDRIKPKLLIGERKPRQHVLEDVEIRAFWQATEVMTYPFGPLLRLLLLTGARKNEIGAARWREVDLAEKVLTVPPERFKSDAPHIIPLTPAAMALVDELPRFNKGDYLFSTTFGERHVSGFGKAKERLDRLMAEELGAKFAPFRIHDLRRTVRTRLASLKIPDMTADLVIGHGKKGLQRVSCHSQRWG